MEDWFSIRVQQAGGPEWLVWIDGLEFGTSPDPKKAERFGQTRVQHVTTSLRGIGVVAEAVPAPDLAPKLAPPPPPPPPKRFAIAVRGQDGIWRYASGVLTFDAAEEAVGAYRRNIRPGDAREIEVIEVLE